MQWFGAQWFAAQWFAAYWLAGIKEVQRQEELRGNHGRIKASRRARRIYPVSDAPALQDDEDMLTLGLL